jgi:hypothetical protein
MNARYRIPLVVLAGLLVAPSLLGPARGADDSAVRLVSAMKSDYADLLKLQLSAEWAYRDGKVTQQTLDCVKALSRSSFTPIFAKTFRDALTQDEIEDALTFFESPLGQKVIARRIAIVHRIPGDPYPGSVPTYTKDDLHELRGIAKKSWGEKLIRYTVVDQPAHKKAVNDKADELLQSCAGR